MRAYEVETLFPQCAATHSRWLESGFEELEQIVKNLVQGILQVFLKSQHNSGKGKKGYGLHII